LKIEAILEKEGYKIAQQGNQFLLVDIVGEFTDSVHPTMEELEAYVREHIEPAALLD